MSRKFQSPRYSAEWVPTLSGDSYHRTLGCELSLSPALRHRSWSSRSQGLRSPLLMVRCVSNLELKTVAKRWHGPVCGNKKPLDQSVCPVSQRFVVELRGFEPLTPCMRFRLVSSKHIQAGRRLNCHLNPDHGHDICIRSAPFSAAQQAQRPNQSASRTAVQEGARR